MRRGHKVNRSRPPRLLLEKNLREPFLTYFHTLAAMTDFMVLTIGAAQIAIGEKHRPCAPLTDQTGFLH
jgi:hypothetical protein